MRAPRRIWLLTAYAAVLVAWPYRSAVLGEAASQPTAATAATPININGCTRTFTPSLKTTKIYRLKAIELGVFDPPKSSSIKFLIAPSSDLTQNFTDTIDKNWREGAILPRRSLQFNSPFQRVKLNNGEKQSQIVYLTPALFVGTKVYCLLDLFRYNKYKASDVTGEDADYIDEVWYGTTTSSPIYAAVRLRWSPSPPKIGSLSCSAPEANLMKEDGIRCSFTPDSDKTAIKSYSGTVTINENHPYFKEPESKVKLEWQVFAPPEKVKVGALATGYPYTGYPYKSDKYPILVQSDGEGAISDRPISLEADQSKGDGNLAGIVSSLTLRSGN